MDAQKLKTNSKVCQSLRKESFDALFMLISALIFYYVFSLLAKEDLFGPNSWDSYTLQSLAWLSGRTDLGRDYEWLELAIYNGKYYVSFPPVPSLVNLPFALLFGENVPANLIVAIYGSVSIVLAYKIMMLCGRDGKSSAFWALFLVWGSNMLWMTTEGGVWFQAQALNMLLCLAAVYFALKDRSTLSLAFCALAVGCRPFSAVYLMFLALYFIRKHGLKSQLRSYIIPALIASSMMAYNYIRFGNVLEFGHNYLPEFTRSENGQFSFSYLLPNLKNILFRIPVWENGALRPVHDGFCLFIADPLFVVLAVHQVQNLISRNTDFTGVVLTAAVTANLLFLCMHKTMGGWQFGARYTCDLLPFAYMYLALKGRLGRVAPWEFAVGIFAFLFNLFGAFYMHLA